MNEQQPSIINNFLDVFNRINIDSLDLLDQIYAKEIVFEDPLHKIEGLDNLKEYFEKLYKNLIESHFEWHHVAVTEKTAFVNWTMYFRHQSIKGGSRISVAGCSCLNFEQKAIFHRDYFDAGELIYEHVPLLGNLINLIKKRI